MLEENFEASGFKATTALSLNGRKYIIRKTRKGWVQEVDGQPEFWRAVKRVQRHSAPVCGTRAGHPSRAAEDIYSLCCHKSPVLKNIEIQSREVKRTK